MYALLNLYMNFLPELPFHHNFLLLYMYHQAQFLYAHIFHSQSNNKIQYPPSVSKILLLPNNFSACNYTDTYMLPLMHNYKE